MSKRNLKYKLESVKTLHWATMKDVFEQVTMHNVINFIKENHFYNLL